MQRSQRRFFPFLFSFVFVFFLFFLCLTKKRLVLIGRSLPMSRKKNVERHRNRRWKIRNNDDYRESWYPMQNRKKLYKKQNKKKKKIHVSLLFASSHEFCRSWFSILLLCVIDKLISIIQSTTIVLGIIIENEFRSVTKEEKNKENTRKVTPVIAAMTMPPAGRPSSVQARPIHVSQQDDLKLVRIYINKYIHTSRLDER